MDRFLRDKVERALQYAGGTHTLEDVVAAVAKGVFQLWEGEHSLVVTQIIDSPRSRDLLIFIAAGDMEEMIALQPVIMDWGREMGCTRAVFAGRKGWARSFLTREAGWRETLVVYEKELTNGQKGRRPTGSHED